MPLFVLTLLSSIVTYSVQETGGAVQSYPLGSRISNAFVSYITYIGKTIWPNDLAFLYPYRLSLPAWQVFGAVLLLTAITITVMWKARKAPYLATGWLWYAGTLVPVIGIVQVGIQARADRYTYVPLIGLFIMVAWGISELSKNWRYRKEVLFASSTVVLLCLCALTGKQAGYWRNSITLFDHTIDVTDNNYIAYYNRGAAYSYRGNYQHAIENFDKALSINPEYALAHNNRGFVYAALGNHRQAIGAYDNAIKFNPKYAGAYYNRGNAYLQLGNDRQAIADYDKAIENNPKAADAYNNRAYSYWRLGNQGQAIEDLKTAARLGYKDAQNTLTGKGIAW
jgi:tetratricopeptide (TPR) repeat protein